MSAQTPQNDPLKHPMWQLAMEVNEVMADRDRLKALCEELREALQRLTDYCTSEPIGKLKHMNELDGRIAWYEGLGPLKTEARAALKKAQKDI
jgi:hypothetical protein